MTKRGERGTDIAEDAFEVGLDLVEPVPDVLDMGAPFELVVATPCDAPCDLGQASFQIQDDDRTIAEGAFGDIEHPTRDPDAHDPRDGPVDLRPRVRIRVTAPAQGGRFRWRLVVPRQVIDGVSLKRAELTFDFSTGQHRMSLAAWNAPSPVETGSTFRFKVGAKCSAGCDLSGLPVVATGTALFQTTLGPAPDANGLYCGEIEITAPSETGLHECFLRLRTDELPTPHGDASGAISFVATPPAAHRVQVLIRARETGAPLADAQVRLGVHRNATNAEGAACFHVASGPHRLFVWKADHAFAETIVDIQNDQDLTILGDERPKKNPYSRWDG
jgi:hypothetical protein